MSLLSIVRAVAGRVGIPRPTSVAGSTDEDTIQLQGLLESVGQQLVQDYNWQALRKSTDWTSVLGTDQGALSARTGNGYKSIVRGTFWDFTERRPIFGPMTDQEWQEYKAFQPGGPFWQFRIASDRVLVNPSMPAGHTIGWIWESNWWVANSGGTAIGDTFVSDTDISLLPEDMMKLGLEAEWRMKKGLAYAEEARKFQDMVDSKKAKDGSKSTLSMDTPTRQFRPGIWVPAGNWPLP